jgi:hypothetical protein
MLAAFLDPRTKDLRVFGEGDKVKIYDEVKRRCELIAAAAPRQQPPQRAAAGREGRPRSRKRDVYALFDDDDILDPPAPAAAGVQGGAVAEGPVDREIREYKAAPMLKRILIVEDGPEPEILVNNPLKWWKEHRQEFPRLAALARRVLCIPASSAPSERLFSHAGLTIANDRARLLPQNAAELIYLHDAWPVAEELAGNEGRREV